MFNTSSMFFSLVFHFEGLPVVTMSAADIATHVDIRQEIHFDRLNTGSPTCLTPSALDIERKTARLESPNLSIRCRLEQFANIGKHVGIGRRIATRGLADGRLIHHNQLIDIFDSDNLLVGQRLFVRVVKTTAQRPPQRSIDQSGTYRYPLTPVTQIRVPNGKSTVIFFRLFPLAPRTVKNEPFPLRRCSGSSIRRRPVR